uniref:Uncharacterized protein n=1 Tax=Panagrolaimus sp. ES5 TaxID=591445 RepID=A0AC34GXT8_9BILA
MGDTVAKIEDHGKVFVKSEIQKFVVNFEWDEKSHFSGDYGYEKDEEIYISCRVKHKTKGLKPSNEIQEPTLQMCINF